MLFGVNPTGGNKHLSFGSSQRDPSIGDFAIAPGHGDLIEDGPLRVESYLEHRLAREQMVAAALSKGPATASELVPLIYQRLSPALTRAAASSVWAHLRRLHELGRARCDDPDDLSARWEAL